MPVLIISIVLILAPIAIAIRSLELEPPDYRWFLLAIVKVTVLASMFFAGVYLFCRYFGLE